MDLHWLEDALVLLEERNLTRAAARRNITQPAFSRRIRGFEDWLGAPILDRGKNRIEVGEALAANEPEIRAMIRRLQELRVAIASFDKSSSTITIAAQHAPIFSTFPDMANLARKHFPALKFRMRAGNQRESVTLFLRGDADILLCYEGDGAPPLPFDSVIRRNIWGRDRLVPVAGGALRYLVSKDGHVPDDAPSIVYPEDSYFGEVLGRANRDFATRATSRNPVCETAFSNGIKELALKGLGIGWLPISMAHREIERGELISLANRYGSEGLEIALYGNQKKQMAGALLDIWRDDRRRNTSPQPGQGAAT